jgi:diacylglycerol kinase family enzyme
MQAHVIFNPTSGIIKQRYRPADLEMALAVAGYTPVYHPTTCEGDLDGALDGAEGIVVAAGGDGTVRAAAGRLIGRPLPLVILPMGTANNVARALGIDRLKPADLARLVVPEKRPFDVGLVHTPWGDDFFLEGAGFGFFADMLSTYDPDLGKSLLRGLATVFDSARHLQGYACRLVLDGEELLGEYVLVEVLNTNSIGPRLSLAPFADPGDGLLDLAVVHKEESDSLARYLINSLANRFDQLPNVHYFRGRKLEIAWSGFPLHVDAVVQPAVGWSSPAFGQITIEVLPQALELWLPGTPAS